MVNFSFYMYFVKSIDEIIENYKLIKILGSYFM